VNGTDLGSTECSGGICLWRTVHLRPGSNDLRATADIGGAPIADSIQWTFSGTPSVVRIKAGDISGYRTADGQRSGSDMYFVGGEGKGVNPPDTPAERRAAIEALTDPRLYDSFREGEFSYRIPVPDGRYKITLKFVEPVAGAGERVFDVAINGKRVLQRFDIFAATGGKLKAVDKSFAAKARDGVLLVEFKPVKGQAVVSGLAIEPAK
jgi:beta-galactosidase